MTQQPALRCNRLSTVGALALGVGLVLAGTEAQALNWQYNPRVEVGGQADDNYRLLPSGNESSVSGALIDAQVEFQSLDQVNDIRIAPGVHATYFPNAKDDDSTNPYLDFEWLHKGLRNSGGVYGSYTKESVVQSERLGTDFGGIGSGGGLGNPIGGDSGYVSIRNKREMGQLHPTYNIELTERRRLEFTADYAHVKFDQDIPGLTVGYTSYGASVGLAQELSQKNTLTVRGLVTRTDPNGDNNTTNGIGLQGEWSRRFTETSQAYVRLGAQRTKFDQFLTGGSPNETTFIAGTGVNWQYRVSQLFLDLTRTVDPNASGFSVKRDQVRMRYIRYFTPLVAGYVGARAYKDRAADSRATFTDRNYAVGSLGLQWRFLRSWTLSGEYDYTRQKFDNGLGPSKSNAVFLSVIFEPNRSEKTIAHFRSR